MSFLILTKIISRLKSELVERKNNLEISQIFSKELEAENQNFHEFVQKQFQDKKLFFSELEIQSQEDTAKQNNDIRFLIYFSIQTFFFCKEKSRKKLINLQ